MPALFAKNGLCSPFLARSTALWRVSNKEGTIAPRPTSPVGRGSFAGSTSWLACDGRRVRLGGGSRHDHPLTERHARRGRRPLPPDVCFLAVLAQVEAGELLAHAGLGAERGRPERPNHA